MTFTAAEKAATIERLHAQRRVSSAIVGAILDDYRKLAAEEALEADIAAEVAKVRAST